MPLPTTVIGSFPKPDYLQMPDMFRAGRKDYIVSHFGDYLKGTDKQEFEAATQRALEEAIHEQTNLGIDVITDGEIARENYIFHFCRRVKGIDFENLTVKAYRNGARVQPLPTIRSCVEPGTDKPWCVEEWKKAQALTQTPVKMTIPGPMTITDTTANTHYTDTMEQSLDLVKVINREVRALAEAGCKYIQIDEPVIARNPEVAVKYGIDHLQKCFEGVGDNVMKVTHLCCGYPMGLDHQNYHKADVDAYSQVADALDATMIDAVSIEDAHRHIDLSLLSKFQRTKVIFGVIAIAQSRVESVEEIHNRVKEALNYIPPERLILAPDCGLAYLPKNILRQKITNMVTAAKSLP